jgi:hypothetical protein
MRKYQNARLKHHLEIYLIDTTCLPDALAENVIVAAWFMKYIQPCKTVAVF